MVRVTCVELPDDLNLDVWNKLVKHLDKADSELLVLNEMPASPWFAYKEEFNISEAKEAVQLHLDFLENLATLNIPVVSSRPILDEDRLYNEAFLIDSQGYIPVHTKHYFPDEPGFYEARWFKRRRKEFKAFKIGASKAGVMLCTDLWFSEHARGYGNQGAHFILVPRATGDASLGRWVIGLQNAAIVSGTYVISSNRVGVTPWNDFAGYGCIINPAGETVCHTSQDKPFVTYEVDPKKADIAKLTYPRYVKE